MAYMIGPPSLGLEPHEQEHAVKVFKKAKALAKRHSIQMRIVNFSIEFTSKTKAQSDRDFMRKKLLETFPKELR